MGCRCSEWRWTQRGSGPADGRDGGRRLARAGAARVLVPEDFPFWEELERAGLRPVDPLPLAPSWRRPYGSGAAAPPRGGPVAGGGGPAGEPGGAGSGPGGGGAVPQGAGFVPLRTDGGGELERYLHRQYGVALRPDWDGVQAAIRFDPRAEEAGQAVLSLFGPEADLAGLAVSVPGLERQKEGQWLPLLEILWETGRLERTDLEFT